MDNKKTFNFNEVFDAAELVKMYESEAADRSTLDALYQELAELTFPRKDNIIKIRHTEQKVENQEVYDDTAIQANITLSNGLQTYLTPPNVKWFNLRVRNEALSEDEDIKEYFASGGEQIFKTISGSNFSEQIHENYLDLGGFGTSCIFVDEDEKDDVRFYTLSIPHGVYIWEDSKGRVNKIMRKVEFTTTQALEEFSNDAGENILKAWGAKDYDKKFKFLHCVGERHVRKAGKKDAKNLPYYSKWVNLEMKKLVKESGYHEMPFFVARFYKNPTSKYGFSPNMMCLPSIKSANRARRQILQAGDIALQPPLDVPYKGYMGRININPQAVNYRRQGDQDGQGIRPIVTIDPRGYSFSGENLQDLRNSIKQAYFVNMFLALEEKTNMTATEVAERINEKMAQLGPALKRLENEMLQGIIHRVFMILLRAGKIAQPPESLAIDGGEYDIAYTSRLELAQKMSEVNGVNQYLNSMAANAQMHPEILDNVDFDNVSKYLEGAYSVNPMITRRPEDRDAIRKQRAEQAQQQAMLQAFQVASQSGKNLASAEKETKQGDAIGRAA